ncbi:rab3 GTPase-activating protein catalytic subunit isoform X3 [Impatiens glandulifera]|uniref:rab3 GTPase-activating protein catalytic subunit isoform X3 n=1 Tax=Impatiens glandulifera TaxID=253017 RepID=UPI001FB0EFB4|nr:rab3 GTPase-activating protein catalytic subunit isoform X3 [Impatiens glandulifera]
MEDSFVWKARTAFHSAAAKAEKVFTDIKKSDSLTDPAGDHSHHQSSPNSKSHCSIGTADSKSQLEEKRFLSGKPAPLTTKQDWQERFRNFRIGKKGIEDTESPGNSNMSFAIFDTNLYLKIEKDNPEDSEAFPAEGIDATSISIIPPLSVVKQLATAIEAGKRIHSMKDVLATSRDSSPVKDRAISAVKSLVLREKDEKFTAEFGGDKNVAALMNKLLSTSAEGASYGRKSGSGSDAELNMSLPKEIHGTPPESFVVKISEVIGGLKTLRKMSLFWFKVVEELRRLWDEDQYIPGIPLDEIPDLNSCLLYQQLQVINCCISRKRRLYAATESLESIISQASHVMESSIPESPFLYARTSTGEFVLRLGTDKQYENLTMLETGEPIYTPVTQEGPLLTEDLIKETEEFVLRTGSVGAGCSQLLSDMQAFKAANPGCILEDFVRWHSPPDWMEADPDVVDNNNNGDAVSARGQLSSRMQKEGNLWRELWETSKPVPSVKQAPLFDEDLAVEGILISLEDISASDLFEQLFISLIGSAFVIAEDKLSTNSALSKLFHECKDYIVATCGGKTWPDKVDDICQVYDTVEIMLIKPDEVLKAMDQPEENSSAGEPKRRFKKLGVIFGGKDKQSRKDQFFSSMFSKKPPRPGNNSPTTEKTAIEHDWAVV